jgi:hypothetical protein
MGNLSAEHPSPRSQPYEPGLGTAGASVLALTEDSQITKMVRVCGHEDAGMHLAVS